MPRKTKHNDLTSPELLDQVNEENKRLKQDFLDYLKSVQRSEGTINGYAHDIDIWCVWNLQRNRNKPFVDMTKRDLISFQNWLISENENSPSRVRRIKSTLSSMSNYVENILDDEYRGYRSIIRKVESPINQPVREKTVFTDEQLKWLLDRLTEKGKYLQACAVALAMCSGRRKSELPRFKASWFADDHIVYGSLYKTPEKVKTKGRGNGKFIHCFTLVNDFKPYFDRFMEWRESNGITSEWLLFNPSNPAEPMNVTQLSSWAITFSNMLGVPFYWHSLRHYFTTRLSQSGLPDSVVQLVVGWTSADMVRLYDDTPDDVQIGKYFEGGGIKKDIQQSSLSDL